MAPIDVDVNSLATASTWINLIPNVSPFHISLVTVILVPLCFAAIFASPTRMIIRLNREIEHMGKLYNEAVSAHLFDFRLQADLDVSNRFLALDDEARRLRIKTLDAPSLRWWCSGFHGLVSGHSLAIWKCTRNTSSLNDKIQLIMEAKAQDFNTAFALGISPSRQVWLRHRGSLFA
ncbi:hypothetical protein B0H11DRAFT_1355163 [Mycena galericulata]|nr:hypothetical protein B0H11DRAFT_438271 [Mycena galericulata]KAJ7472462.1 hypothetical protein B0H11DRAFT_1355163 [Mycena galericulata]